MAGYNYAAVQKVMTDTVGCVKQLHEYDLIHGDIKARNILRHGSTGKWILCDLDAAAKMGDKIGKKTSSAYAPPELARSKYVDREPNGILTDKTFDIWSIGVVLYELCTGHTLFSQDMSNNEIVLNSDKTELCLWNTISDERLESVFSQIEGNSSVALKNLKTHAKHLIRWCLKGNAADRPTPNEILDHPFCKKTKWGMLQNAQTAVKPMAYHQFICHAPEAVSVAETLYVRLQYLGTHSWVHEHREKIEKDGNLIGVENSNLFILCLTKKVFYSTECRNEILKAVETKKDRIQLIVEANERFQDTWFDYDDFKESKGAHTRSKDIPGHQQIHAMLAETWPKRIIFRRRDYENKAMIQELYARGGMYFPSEAFDAQEVTAEHELMLKHKREGDADLRQGQGLMKALELSAGLRIKIFVLFSDKLAKDSSIRTDMQHVITNSPLLQLHDSPSDADRILMVLTEGVVAAGSSTLDILLGSQLLGSPILGSGRITFVEHKWEYDSPEAKGVPQQLQEELDDCTPITYRAVTEGIGSDLYNGRHEFTAMSEKIQRLLSREITHAPAALIRTRSQQIVDAFDKSPRRNPASLK